jgi:hypothetical protein
MSVPNKDPVQSAMYVAVKNSNSSAGTWRLRILIQAMLIRFHQPLMPMPKAVRGTSLFNDEIDAMYAPELEW